MDVSRETFAHLTRSEPKTHRLHPGASRNTQQRQMFHVKRDAARSTRENARPNTVHRTVGEGRTLPKSSDIITSW